MMSDYPIHDDHPMPLFEQQQVHLERVTSKLAQAILRFVESRQQWHAEELHDYVRREAQAAPASADRVLRALRQDGHVNYRVVNRRQSLYEVIR